MQQSSAISKLAKLHHSGDLFCVSLGLRCNNPTKIVELIGSAQPSYPFDAGFFTPQSVLKILKKGNICCTDFIEKNSNNLLSMYKHEYYIKNGKLGIYFKSIEFGRLNSIIDSYSNITLSARCGFLDGTLGYFTLNSSFDFILAHYIWHKKSLAQYNQGVTDVRINISKAVEILNRRIERFNHKVASSKFNIFIYGEYQGFDFMRINDNYYDLNKVGGLREYVLSLNSNSKALFIHNKNLANMTSQKLVNLLEI